MSRKLGYTKEITLISRLSELNVLDQKDMGFVEDELKNKTKADLVREAINIYRKYKNGQLVEKEDEIETRLKSIEELVVSMKNNVTIKPSGDDSEEEDEEENEWNNDEDFKELLEGINDIVES